MEALLTWPTTSNAFAAVHPTGRDDSRGSPPRKTARLEGDIDSSAKGKGKQRAQDAALRGVRKLIVVTNGVTISGLSPADDSSYTNTIRHALRWLLDRHGSIPFLPSSYKAVYDAVETAVSLGGKGPEVYAMLGRELDRACAEGIARRLTEGNGILWLASLVDEWKWFHGRLNLLRALLTWLDRAYLAENGFASVMTLGYKAFEQHVICGNVFVHDKIAPCIEEWANAERNTKRESSAHRGHVRSLIDMFQLLGLYQSDFHTPYTLATRAFYITESNKLSSGRLTPTQFVSHCIERVAEEVQRCREVLAEESLLSVEQTVERSLLDGRIAWLAQDGVGPLVDANDAEGLRKTYDLFHRVDALEPLKLAFAQSVEKTVAKIVLLSPVDEEEMIPKLLDFKAFVDSLLVAAFRENAKIEVNDTVIVKEEPVDKGKGTDRTSLIKGPAAEKKKRGKGPFGYAATDAFAKGFAKRQRKPAEMIAKFIDKAMRKGQKGRSDKEFEDKLNAVLALYQFTRDRDVFRTFYWRALAKRLLLQRSASDDFEKAVIKKLRDGYDPEFGKGDEMFKDLALSKDLLLEYQARSEDKSLSVMVLQYSCWPYQPKKTRDVDLPPSMLAALQKYSNFYQGKHKSRKLDWFHSLGTVTLTARFPKGDKELSVSLYQATILLLFNDVTKLAFSEIKQQTSMVDDDLRRTLQSLACGKKRVLKKIPPGKDVDDNDEFVYNAEFTDSNRKLHINSIQQKETAEESKATDSKIQEDRGYLLDAAIVRIMKGRKRMTNQTLITETVVAVKGHFQPDVKQIKKQIDSLTDREYIRRDEDNRDVYHYVA